MSDEILRIFKFVLVGVWNTLFDLGLFWLFINTLGKLKLLKNYPKNIATFSHILSFLIANSVSYVLNSNFTFSGSNSNRGWVPYLFVTLFSLSVSTSVIYVLTRPEIFKKLNALWKNLPILSKFTLDEKRYALIIKLFTASITMLTNYIGYRYFVF